MANFNIAHKLTFINEGGYANNPNDTGGETYKGIARKHNPSWQGWLIIDAIKHKYGTSPSVINKRGNESKPLQDLVDSLYKANYWDVLRLDDVNNQDIANTLFDCSVNMGYSVAARFLQEALNLCNKNGQSYPDIVVDGKIGNITLGVLNNKANATVIFNTINLLKGEKYINIMRANKSQEVFWQGWIKRALLK